MEYSISKLEQVEKKYNLFCLYVPLGNTWHCRYQFETQLSVANEINGWIV